MIRIVQLRAREARLRTRGAMYRALGAVEPAHFPQNSGPEREAAFRIVLARVAFSHT